MAKRAWKLCWDRSLRSRRGLHGQALLLLFGVAAAIDLDDHRALAVATLGGIVGKEDQSDEEEDEDHKHEARVFPEVFEHDGVGLNVAAGGAGGA